MIYPVIFEWSNAKIYPTEYVSGYGVTREEYEWDIKTFILSRGSTTDSYFIDFYKYAEVKTADLDQMPLLLTNNYEFISWMARERLAGTYV